LPRWRWGFILNFVRKTSLFFLLSLLLLLPACGDSGDDDDSTTDDDDSGQSDDDDSGGADLVDSPGVIHIALAAAVGTEVELDLTGPAPGLGLRLRDCDKADGWHDVPLGAEQTPSLTMSVELPPMPRGSQLCALELTFSEDVQIAGSYDLEGGETQPFLLVLEVGPLTFDLDPLAVVEDGDVALILQVGQEDWITPAQIGIPPEPEREEVFVIGWAHSAYNSFVQQLEAFSGVYFDLNGDGSLGPSEAGDADRPGAGLPRPSGQRFAAFGPSICLDEEGVELPSCVNPEFHSPLIYKSLDAGISWSLADSPNMSVPSDIRSAAYGRGLYLAVGGADSTGDGQLDKGIILSSVDAETWGAWLVDEPLIGITHADFGMPWVGVSASGTTYRSDNGVAWKVNAGSPLNFEPRDVGWSGAGLFVAVGGQGRWGWSIDGEQWTTEDGLNHSGTPTSLRQVAATSVGNVLAVGDLGAWLELENPADFAAGLEGAIWTQHSVSGAPDLTDIAVYVDAGVGETAVAVGPDMSVPILVTQFVSDSDVSDPPFLTALSPGIQAQTISVMDNRCFTIGGDGGLSSWLDNLLGVSAGVPHDQVTHGISVVLTGGE
jgi:hypothetical protein